MKQFLLLLLCLTLIGCTYAPVVGPRRFDPLTEPTLVPTTEAVARPIYTVEEGLVTQRLVFEARVSPRREREILPLVEGTIGFIQVETGDFVVAGDPIAGYDDGNILEQMAAIEAEIATQRALQADRAAQQAQAIERAQLEIDIAQLELDKATENRAEIDSEEDTTSISMSISETERDLLTRRLELAQGDYEQLLASIDTEDPFAEGIATLQDTLEQLKLEQTAGLITAPTDGIVVGLAIQPGSRVNPENSVGMIAALGGIDDLSLASTLRSESLEQIAEGMPVTIRFDQEGMALIDQTFSGSIARLPYPYNVGGQNLGFDDADSAVRILPDDLALFDQVSMGQLATITVVVAQNEAAIWVDPSAVREFSGRNFVIVRDGTRERRVDVELGLQEEGRVELIGAIEPGQEVVGP